MSEPDDMAATSEFVAIWCGLQMRAIETQDTRIQKLADDAWGVLDDTVVKAVMLAWHKERQEVQAQPNIAAMLASRGRR